MAATPERKGWRRYALPVGLSAGVLVAVLALTVEPETWPMLRASFRPLPLVGAVAASALWLAVGGGWVRHLSGGALGWWAGCRAFLAREFFSAVTPSVVGGAPLAAVFVAKDTGRTVGQSGTMLLLLMLLDHVWFCTLAVGLFVATLTTPLLPPSFGTVGGGAFALYLLALIGWTGLLTYAVLLRPTVFAAVVRGVFRLRPLRRFEGRAKEEASRLTKEALLLKRRGLGFFAVGYGWAVLAWACRYAVVLGVVKAVAPAAPVGLTLLKAAAVWLSALVMPTPGGAGGLEGMFALFFAPVVAGALVGPAVTAWRLLSFYAVLALGAALTAGRVGARLTAPAARNPEEAAP